MSSKKELPAKEEPPSGGGVICVTSRRGIRYLLSCPDPMTEEFKRLAQTLQGNPEVDEPCGRGYA